MVTYRQDDGWGVLADPTRRSIVLQLAQCPQAVVELASTLPISRPAVSQHLKVLKDAGLVAEHAEGTRRIYHLNEAGLTALRDQLDTFWSRALANYQDVIDESPEEHTWWPLDPHVTLKVHGPLGERHIAGWADMIVLRRVRRALRPWYSSDDTDLGRHRGSARAAVLCAPRRRRRD